MQKKSRNTKKAENARSISKLMQKKDINVKKRQKIHCQFRNSYKKYQKGKKESTFIWIFFAFISPVHFLRANFKPKNSYKKRQKCKKKA